MDISRFKTENGIASLITKRGAVLIDPMDLHYLSLGELDINPSGYIRIRNRVSKFRKFIHRLVTSAPNNMEVDHINHNPLDNRRCNLRICTKSENSRNNQGQKTRKAKYKGTYYEKRSKVVGKHYRAYTRVNGKKLWFGYYATEEDAARAYNKNALKLFGRFACLNDIRDTPRHIGTSSER
jgi:hypothetical protein